MLHWNKNRVKWAFAFSSALWWVPQQFRGKGFGDLTRGSDLKLRSNWQQWPGCRNIKFSCYLSSSAHLPANSHSKWLLQPSPLCHFLLTWWNYLKCYWGDLGTFASVWGLNFFKVHYFGVVSLVFAVAFCFYFGLWSVCVCFYHVSLGAAALSAPVPASLAVISVISDAQVTTHITESFSRLPRLGFLRRCKTVYN